MKNLLLFAGLLWVLAGCNPPLREDEKLVESLLRSRPEYFSNLLDSADQYEIQIIYTQINRNEKNFPSFRSFYFHADSTHYFYPASTVKFPAVLLALEKLNRLGIQHLDKFTPMIHDSAYSGQRSVSVDTTSENNMPSVAHYSKKILVVSDNDAFNRLYEFLGQKEFNARLREKGYEGTYVVHRLDRPLSLDENAHTEAVTFFQKHGVVYRQPMQANDQAYEPSRKVMKGNGFIRKDSLINEPFDFTYKNTFPLAEQQRMLKAIIFPSAVEESARFQLTAEDRQFVLKYMSQLPTETIYPPYAKDTAYYTDAYCKFFMFGGKGTIPRHIRIFNKVGDAYGFLIDNAYIVDFTSGVEFMLSAVIHVNKDGIYNDGVYEYDKVGFPFFKNLGKVIYEYELTREKKSKPNLSEFKFHYDKE
jgi:hypothetical protein